MSPTQPKDSLPVSVSKWAILTQLYVGILLLMLMLIMSHLEFFKVKIHENEAEGKQSCWPVFFLMATDFNCESPTSSPDAIKYYFYALV